MDIFWVEIYISKNKRKNIWEPNQGNPRRSMTGGKYAGNAETDQFPQMNRKNEQRNYQLLLVENYF